MNGAEENKFTDKKTGQKWQKIRNTLLLLLFIPQMEISVSSDSQGWYALQQRRVGTCAAGARQRFQLVLQVDPTRVSAYLPIAVWVSAYLPSAMCNLRLGNETLYIETMGESSDLEFKCQKQRPAMVNVRQSVWSAFINNGCTEQLVDLWDGGGGWGGQPPFHCTGELQD